MRIWDVNDKFPIKIFHFALNLSNVMRIYKLSLGCKTHIVDKLLLWWGTQRLVDSKQIFATILKKIKHMTKILMFVRITNGMWVLCLHLSNDLGWVLCRIWWLLIVVKQQIRVIWDLCVHFLRKKSIFRESVYVLFDWEILPDFYHILFASVLLE